MISKLQFTCSYILLVPYIDLLAIILISITVVIIDTIIVPYV